MLTRKDNLLRYAVAFIFAFPISIIIWAEILYLIFGITGREVTAVTTVTAFIFAFGLTSGYALHRTKMLLHVIQRSCRIGIISALLLPVVAVVVQLLWKVLPNRPDLGMGGMTLNLVPLIAIILAIAAAGFFWIVNRFATQHLQISEA